MLQGLLATPSDLRLPDPLQWTLHRRASVVPGAAAPRGQPAAMSTKRE